MPLVVVGARPPEEFLDIIKIEDWDQFYDDIQSAQQRDDDGCEPLSFVLVALFVVFIVSFVLAPCAVLIIAVFVLRRLHALKENQKMWHEVRRIVERYDKEVFSTCGVEVAIVVHEDDQAVLVVKCLSEDRP